LQPLAAAATARQRPAVSLRVMTWAWSVALPPTPKLVLMALADEADDSGYCFPSQRRLATKCSVTDRTVRRVLQELERLGYVRLETRQRADGSRSSNGYRLVCGIPPDNLSGGVDTHVRGPRTSLSGVVDTGVRTLPTNYPLSNPPPPPPAAVKRCGKGGADASSGGGSKWQFPSELSPGHVAALREVLAGIGEAQGQEVLDELSGRLKIGQVGNPIRYCAALVERVGRGEFRPELGIRIAEMRGARARYLARLNAPATIDSAGAMAAVQHLPDELREPLERMRSRDAQDRSSDACDEDTGTS